MRKMKSIMRKRINIYEYERGNWMKMKMEKQFKVIIEDEDV